MALQFTLGLSMIFFGIVAGFCGAEAEGICMAIVGAIAFFLH